MTHLVEFDPVRTLFGDGELPAPYEIVLSKILNDNLVLIRLKDLMERAFAARAIAQMREHEIATLTRRITLALNPPAPIPSLAEMRTRELAERAKVPKPTGFVPAEWMVRSHAGTFGEKTVYLQAQCEKCGQETKAADATVLFEHCGAVERVPDEAARQLRRAQGIYTDNDAYAEIIGGQKKPATPAPVPVKEKVSWFVESAHGEWRITAQVPGEFMTFSGLPKDASKFFFHGEQCPQGVIEEYTRHRAGA